MEFLAGLHPRFVHFPIVLFILYFIFETAAIFWKKEGLSLSAYILLIGGIVTALIAVMTGNQAETVAQTLIPKDSALKNLIELHQDYATTVLWFYFGILVLRTYLMVKKKFAGNIRMIFIALGLMGCYLVYMAGSVGGDLVFKYGIGTQLFGK